MDLLSPWFLAGGLAVGLPLWLHLMRRQNPVRLEFSSLMFFRKRTETTVRERRLQYLLLLALRLALLLLLAVTFAGPIWERPPTAITGDAPKLHVVAVDTSMSMQYGNRWETALDAARGIIDSLGRGDRAQLIANGPSVRVLTDATEDVSTLRSVLADLEPTDARNNYGDVIEAVRTLVGSEITSVVHLVTDLQSSAMPARFRDLVLPDSAELVVHDVAGGESTNWAIDSIKGAARLFGEERPRFDVTVANFGPQTADRTVSLSIDGRVVGSERRAVPAGGRSTYAFEITDPPRGFSRAEFRLEPPDRLTVDDMRRIALDNSDPDRILFVTQDARRRDLVYFRSAVEASATRRYRLDSVSPGEAARLDPGGYALVVLSDVSRLERGFDVRLRSWVEAGGAVFVALGPNSTIERRAALTDHALEQPLSSERGGQPFQVAGEADRSHAVVGAAEGLRPVKFFLYARVQPEEGDTVPMRLGNGDPILIERTVGSGRVLVFASTLDNVWNDLPLTPVFVPFVAEMARHLTGARATRGRALLGDVIELGALRGAGGAVQVIDSSGESVLGLSDSVSRETIALESLGFYEIRGGSRSELVAVNPDPRESSLARIEPDTLAIWQSTGQDAEVALETAGVPSGFTPIWRVWRLLLLLLLGLALIESAVGNRHLDAVRGD